MARSDINIILFQKHGAMGIIVQSEASETGVILESKISAEDIYQRQQGTNIALNIILNLCKNILRNQRRFNAWRQTFQIALKIIAENILDTLIVWNEPSDDEDGIDLAISFQEPQGCTEIWQVHFYAAR